MKIAPFFMHRAGNGKGGNFKTRKFFNYPESFLYCLYSRGKKILEQLSRARFFTGIENLPLIFRATSKKRSRISNPLKNRVLESCSNLFFTLGWLENNSCIWANILMKECDLSAECNSAFIDPLSDSVALSPKFWSADKPQPLCN